MHKQTSGLWLTLIAGMGVLVMAAPTLHAESQKKKDEAEFKALLKALPGEYDNLTQADEDHSGQHAAVMLTIKPLNLQSLGRLVMLARETAANDKHRILSQRLWTLERNKENQIVQQVYVFKEPARWVRAVDDPEILEALVPDDLRQLAGCELVWTKTDTGFTGANRPKACRPPSEQEGMLVQTSAELNGEDLTVTELQAGPGGRLPAQVDPASSYHFQRRGG
jgi:hypothetical protein